MRFGRCEWILRKYNRGNFTRSLIENVFIKTGFSPNNPHFNCVIFFDDMGEENICSESDFVLSACNIHKIINITLWKDYESVEICFDVTDEHYDIFELNINLMDGEECNRLITSITDLVLNSNLDLRGIIFDKNGILRELSNNSLDERFINFAFNEISDIREKLLEKYRFSTHIYKKNTLPSLAQNNISNIYICNFLSDGVIKVDLFELK